MEFFGRSSEFWDGDVGRFCGFWKGAVESCVSGCFCSVFVYIMVFYFFVWEELRIDVDVWKVMYLV